MAFFWFQRTGGESAWNEALSEHRSKIIDEVKPEFVTVLDAHTSPDPAWGRDEYSRMKYSGPFYVDFDADPNAGGIATTIPQFQKFLVNLQELGVNLPCLRLYATGGRGFHIEVPQGVFMVKVPKTGVTALPYVYREMAMEMVVDTLDLRVYTGRRGRMWRVPGIVRSNGKYKVPILVADALSMTPEMYDELCAKPLHEPIRELPTLSTALAAMFIKAQGKVEEGVKRRGKAGVDEALLAKFKGEFPPTLNRIMSGVGIAPGTGFQKIAMQLAITANAMDKTDDELVEACEGLIATHQGDSSRFNSPRKRKEELRRMWNYTNDNPCYSYSRGGIRSLCDVDSATSDLDGLGSSVGIGHVPDNDGDEDELLPEEVQQDLSGAGLSLMEGLLITKSGIHKRTADGARTISNLAFRKPVLLLDAADKKTLGIEADILCDGVSAGRHSVPGKSFTSRANLSGFSADFGGIFSGSDTQAGVVSLMLQRSAKAGGRVVYALNKEGLDVVQNPLVKDRSVKDVVWVHPERVVSQNQAAAYTFQARVGEKPVFNADVHNAPAIVNTPDTLEWLKNLTRINNPVVVAQMLGWNVSCFHRQFYHQAFQQFPLLHPNGPAGCGKTLTSTLLAKMFHLTTDPVLKSCAPSITTPFSLKTAFSGSASIPLILDEYKPSEMGSIRTDLLLQAFRLAYNQGTGSSGGMSRGSANSSFRDITDYTYSTPLVFMAEAQEMQTAIVQRSLPVSFNPADSTAHTAYVNRAVAGGENMSNLGKLLLNASYRETVETRRAALEPIIKELRANFDKSVHDRQVYNLAIVLEGLNYLDYALATVFGDAMKSSIDELRQAVYEHKAEISVSAMSEAAKTVNDMALMSRTEPDDGEFALREGKEYVVKDGYIEVLMRETFVKYFAWCKRKGFTPYYNTAEAFVNSMGKFPPVMDKMCRDSPLKTSGQSRVFRFDLEKLMAEGVEMFKTKSRP